ncbi:MAG TPA: hypothetical protein VGC93_00890 [Thermoanaerobaculia bacterium]|jgi:hypothetical protein
MGRDYLFVRSSARAGCPKVLTEATAFPVVSADRPGGSREVLAGGCCGPIVRAGDGGAPATAIGAAIDALPAPQVLMAGAEPFPAQGYARGFMAEARGAGGMGG